MRKFYVVMGIFLIVIVTAMLLLTGEASHAQGQPKASPTPIATPSPDPLALDAEDKAQFGPIYNDSKKWNDRLADAQKALLETRNAQSIEIEGLKMTLAARDIRDALEALAKVDVAYKKWLGEIQAKHSCADCAPDLQAGKLVKPTKRVDPATSPKP